MIDEETKMALPNGEVLMLVPEVVRQIRQLRDFGWGAKRIAGQLGVARGTVRRYLRAGSGEVVQRRPGAWTLGSEARRLAVELLEGAAAGNGPVVRRLLRERGIETPLRTLQRVLTPHRRARGAAEAATVRYETAPGHQMQIDFGEKQVLVGGKAVRVHLFVAVLGYSRRLYVRASLSQRQEDWAEGLAGAFRHFGGVPQTVLLDNAGALVMGRDRETNMARLHPGFAAFCRDWQVRARVCQPYRARTKGKTESGVGYVKHNGLAALSFASFAALQSHLDQWMVEADGRIHGTTGQRPMDRFERDERTALRPLPASPLAVRQRRLERRVATDCFVDVDTVRYSVPHTLVRQVVEVLVGENEVRIYDGNVVVARHRRSLEPHSRVVEPAHLAELWRPKQQTAAEPSLVPTTGRSLSDYAAVIGSVP